MNPIPPEDEVCRRFAQWDESSKDARIKYDPTADAFHLARLYARERLGRATGLVAPPADPDDLPVVSLADGFHLVVPLAADPKRRISPDRVQSDLAKFVHWANELAKAVGMAGLDPEVVSAPGSVGIAFRPATGG